MFTHDISNKIIDPEGDELRFQVSVQGFSSIPIWIEFFPTKQLFKFSPTIAHLGTFNISITAKDLYLEYTTFFAVAVEDSPPEFYEKIPDQLIKAFHDFEYFIPKENFFDENGDLIYYDVLVEEVGQNTGKVKLSFGCPWLQFEKEPPRLFGKPNVKGNYTIYLQVSDGQLTTELPFQIIVDNYPPIPQISFDDKIVDFDEPFTLYIPSGLFRDPDNDTLRVEVQLRVNNSDMTIPYWVTYTPESKKIVGSIPKEVPIRFLEDEWMYYEVFTLRIKGYDPLNQYGFCDWHVVLRHIAPQPNRKNSLQLQINSQITKQIIVAKPEKHFEFIFSS